MTTEHELRYGKIATGSKADGWLRWLHYYAQRLDPLTNDEGPSEITIATFTERSFSFRTVLGYPRPARPGDSRRRVTLVIENVRYLCLAVSLCAIMACGEYRTKRVILEIYDAMAEAECTGVPYQTRLDPSPADPRIAHEPHPADTMVKET